MILVDFNGLMYQYTFAAVSYMNFEIKEDGHYDPLDLLPPVKTMLLNELFNIQNEYMNRGSMVICVDNTHRGNWRKSIYNHYKCSRGIDEENPIPFLAIFKDMKILLNQLKHNTPWKVISVETAEADDCILCLADTYAKKENILIISSDKDMIQAQKNGNVIQYSPLTRKWITHETKGDSSLKEWIMEHVILGDSADDIPRITDETEFDPNFELFMKLHSYSFTVNEFHSFTKEQKDEIVNKYYEINPNGAVWKKIRLGPKTIKKMMDENTIDKFINKYKDNYERNKKLILSEYIPEAIKSKIISEYEKPKDIKTSNLDAFENYLNSNQLSKVIDKIPVFFRNSTIISIDDFL